MSPSLSFFSSFSLSLIDSLDTLLTLGNVSEFQAAYDRIISKPSFDIDVNTSVFEANIRGKTQITAKSDYINGRKYYTVWHHGRYTVMFCFQLNAWVYWLLQQEDIIVIITVIANVH